MESAMKAQGPELFGELVQFLERVCKDAQWDKCKKVLVEKEMKVNRDAGNTFSYLSRDSRMLSEPATELEVT